LAYHSARALFPPLAFPVEELEEVEVDVKARVHDKSTKTSSVSISHFGVQCQQHPRSRRRAT
jgi:hypothetical protein